LVLFAYVESGKVIGSIGIKEIENNIFKIERLAVLPDQRHNKIGQTLMNYAIDRIKENMGKAAKVEIVYENKQLLKWYEKQGFQVISIDTYEKLPFQVGVLIKEVCEKNNIMITCL
jgi:ribosomal protein S18 acetylase RimI-like enzyme